MKKYNIEVSFGEQGYNDIGNIFKVIKIILKEKKANIYIRLLK